ncbi:MAG: SRPBCC domain-containing protein [Reyranella sp.]|nr:SRPBCC domain-containing protein [Reyranella sp.]
MSAGASKQTVPQRRAFTLKRVLRAPRALVFRAFVEPERMKLWWAPRGFTMLSCALDLREGGAWRMRIRSEETGTVQTEVGTYREIRAPERLVFTHSWVCSNGTLTPTTVVTVTLTEQDGRTEVSFTQADFHSEEFCRSHEQGWASSFSQLNEKVVGGGA